MECFSIGLPNVKSFMEMFCQNRYLTEKIEQSIPITNFWEWNVLTSCFEITCFNYFYNVIVFL